jgi:Putative transposase, YhgA-like
LAGQEAEIYLVFEHKSAFDKLTLVQILTYCAALWEHNILHEKRSPVPVIPVVFYHGKETFEIPRRFGHYFAVDDSLRGYMVDFGYALFNTADLAEDEIARKSYNNLYLGASLMAFKRIFDSLEEMEITLRHVLQLDETNRLRIFEYLVTSKDVKLDEFEQVIREIGGIDMPTIAEQWMEQFSLMI